MSHVIFQYLLSQGVPEDLATQLATEMVYRP